MRQTMRNNPARPSATTAPQSAIARGSDGMVAPETIVAHASNVGDGDPIPSPSVAAATETASPEPSQALLDKSILLIGDPGSGKTKFLGSCPRPLWIADFDKGGATLEDDGDDIAIQVFKDAPLNTRPIPRYGIYKFGEAWDEFQKALNVIGEQIDKGTCPYKTLAIDSFTMFQNCILNHALAHSKHPAGPVEIQDYGTLLGIQKKFFDQFTSWPLLKICTAHVERAKNDLTEATEMLPLGLGKFVAIMPMYFDEIYYLEVKNGTPAQKAEAKKRGIELESIRVLTTQPSAYIKQARTRKNVPTGTIADFKNIEPYLRPRNVG